MTNDHAADLYDAVNNWGADDDYFLNFATAVPKGRVLDLGCGTGRITVAIARTGDFTVTGVDPDRPSLEAARSKPQNQLVDWIDGDSRAIPADRRFDVAIMSSNVAQEILDDDELARTFADIFSHLADDGRLTFDARDLRARGWEAWTKELSHKVVELPDGQSQHWYQTTLVDEETGMIDFCSHEIGPDAVERMECGPLRFRSEELLRTMLTEAGFIVEAVYGGYGHETVEGGIGSLVVVARKPASHPIRLEPSPVPEQSPRKAKPQVILEVLRTERLSPGMVRVIAGGNGFAAFHSNGHTDQYVKIFFAKPELGLVPPYNLDELREQLAPEDLPTTRTYTVRWVDEEAQELALDFVVHGDEGLAGPWAVGAQPGDPLVFRGPGGKYSPNPDADWYLFAGDAAALPAIAAAIEQLPATAVGHAIFEVHTPQDRLEVNAPDGVLVTWLDETDDGGLATAVQSLHWMGGPVDVFAHGERESMKDLRRVFKDKGVDRSQLSLSGYWARGRAEDRFQAEKREPIGKIFED